MDIHIISVIKLTHFQMSIETMYLLFSFNVEIVRIVSAHTIIFYRLRRAIPAGLFPQGYSRRPILRIVIGLHTFPKWLSLNQEKTFMIFCKSRGQ